MSTAFDSSDMGYCGPVALTSGMEMLGDRGRREYGGGSEVSCGLAMVFDIVDGYVCDECRCQTKRPRGRGMDFITATSLWLVARYELECATTWLFTIGR